MSETGKDQHHKIDPLEMLAKLDEVTAEDVEKVRSSLSDEARDLFDEYDNDRKVMLAFINKLSAEEIDFIRWQAKDTLGLHTIVGGLSLLNGLREI